MINTNQLQSLVDGRGTLVDPDGSKIGKIEQAFLDDETGRPEWVTVKTGMFGGSESFVPLAESTAEGSQLRVPYRKDQVKDAPRIDNQRGSISADEEVALYRFYGLDINQALPRDPNRLERDRGAAYKERTPAESTPAESARAESTAAESARRPDDHMIRSEEQLRVGTQQREAGTARLRKYVVTENVTQTVPVSHEEVRVERQPVTDPNARGRIGEDEQTVTLHEEHPVIAKKTVPVEEVRMTKDTVPGEEQVSETVRKERIDTNRTEEHDDNPRR